MQTRPNLLTLFAGLMLSLSAMTAIANDADAIEVENPFVREVPPMAPATASFMTLKNMSDKDIFLVQAKSNVAKTVELHTHTNDNGIMKMREVAQIKIPAKGMAMLKPGGLHIMLIEPTQKIEKGQTVTETLIFKDGSQKTISMPVKSVKGMKMKHHQHHHPMHH